MLSCRWELHYSSLWMVACCSLFFVQSGCFLLECDSLQALDWSVSVKWVRFLQWTVGPIFWWACRFCTSFQNCRQLLHPMFVKGSSAWRVSLVLSFICCNLHVEAPVRCLSCHVVLLVIFLAALPWCSFHWHCLQYSHFEWYLLLQPSNLLRALCQIREASALGLVEGLEEWENGKEKSLAKRIQNFSWFLLEQVDTSIHLDETVVLCVLTCLLLFNEASPSECGCSA